VIEIYNAAGRLVKNINLPSTISNLQSTVAWDGKDNSGQYCPNGVYFLRFFADPVGDAAEFREIRKLLLVK